MSHAGISKTGSPRHQIFISNTDEISNLMGIRLGIDYVSWKNFHKWNPPRSNPLVGHTIEFLIPWV